MEKRCHASNIELVESSRCGICASCKEGFQRVHVAIP